MTPGWPASLKTDLVMQVVSLITGSRCKVIRFCFRQIDFEKVSAKPPRLTK